MFKKLLKIYRNWQCSRGNHKRFYSIPIGHHWLYWGYGCCNCKEEWRHDNGYEMVVLIYESLVDILKNK